jgi:hypothetical protein
MTEKTPFLAADQPGQHHLVDRRASVLSHLGQRRQPRGRARVVVLGELGGIQLVRADIAAPQQ